MTGTDTCNTHARHAGMTPMRATHMPAMAGMTAATMLTTGGHTPVLAPLQLELQPTRKQRVAAACVGDHA